MCSEIVPSSSYLQLLFGVICLFMITIGFFGNVLVIAIVAKVLRWRRTYPNCLIFTLAFVDVFTIIICLFPALLYYFMAFDMNTSLFCNFQGTIVNLLLIMSVLLVSTLSLDRFLALRTPFFYKTHAVFQFNRLAAIVGFFFGFALSLSLLPTFGVSSFIVKHPGTFCWLNLKPTSLEGKLALNANLVMLLLSMLIVLACNLSASWMSYKMLPRAGKQCSEFESSRAICSREECHFLKLSVIVMTLFLFCWLPFTVRTYPRVVLQ